MQTNKLPTFISTFGYVKTYNDLPVKIERWTSNRKIDLIKAVTNKVISVEEVVKRYELSYDEFESWIRQYEKTNSIRAKEIVRTKRVISVEEILKRYELTNDEFDSWVKQYQKNKSVKAKEIVR